MSIKTAAAACQKAFNGVEVGAIVQHCHHERWLEILDEPAENRIDYILNNKAESERETRLKLFRPLSVTDAKRLPAKFRKASAELGKARAEWDKARAEWDKARAEWGKARAEWGKASAEWGKARAGKKLHAEICGCPWSDALDIFGKER